MQSLFRPTRREFLRLSASTGVFFVSTKLALPQNASPSSPGNTGGWMAGPGKARQRIDGLQKVTGAKIYARDFHPRDIPGWPSRERRVLILRVGYADRRLLAIDLSMLPRELAPLRVVTAADLVRDAITAPHTMQLAQGNPTMMAAVNSYPLYIGQPAALLIFADFRQFRAAKQVLQFNPTVLRYGPATMVPDLPQQYPPPTYLTRYTAPGMDFSQTKDGYSNPYASTLLGQPAAVDLAARSWRDQIAADLSSIGWRTFSGTYTTQVLDPMFMEPESGLGWFDRTASNPTLNLVLGTQATNGDIAACAGLFAATNCPIKLQTVVLNSCYPGGGFGGRDVSNFSLWLGIAAAYADAPVRIANDRFEQFQSGLKQLPSTITDIIAVDSNGRITALISQATLGAGGLNNYSQWVANVAGLAAGGAYNLPRVSIDAVAQPTRNVVAGSMRGFGGPQSFFAIESLVDEAAAELGYDPILFREQNVLDKTSTTVTGAPLNQDPRLVEICRLARNHPLWTERQVQKQRRGPGLLYGVGFALANESFGVGGDPVMAAVEIDHEGVITVHSNAVDMGNGSATSMAISTARYLGGNAAKIGMGEAGFFVELGLDPSVQPADWNNPRWTPAFALSSSASITAFHQVHAVNQASRVLFIAGLAPAAGRLWNWTADQVIAAAQWQNGFLNAPTREPLTLTQIAHSAYDAGEVVRAMTHCYFQGVWIVADYSFNGSVVSLPADAVSTLKAGQTQWQRHDRSNTQQPPENSSRYGRSLFTSSGALAAVEVDASNGGVRVTEMQLFLDAGPVIQRDLLEGQAEGAMAMGIGYTLLEQFPPQPNGDPGAGEMNLHRYHVPLATDVPIDRFGLNVLPPLDDQPSNGIAEAVLCPWLPAIGNAVAAATGRRFRQLPITSERILEALRA